MKPILAHVKLHDIALAESNKMFRDDDELTDDALKELIDSVRQVGVIQPVLLRPASGLETHKYELVAGERRYRASVACDLPTIPAKIQELSDEDAFDIQVTENLQRKDISPLKEANAYRYLVMKDPVHNTPAELALKFGKTEHYIHTRLKLNELVHEAKEDLRAGHMAIGHALVLARLQPADQDRALEHCRHSYTYNKEKVVSYETVNEMKDFIENSVMCNLSKASFKKDDASLLPAAGPCTTCSKRSGANQLFSDLATKNDRCFDPACFQLKKTRHLVVNLGKMIEKSPDLVCLKTPRDDVDADVAALLKESNIDPITSNDFYQWDCGGVQTKGIWINGDEIGNKDTVWLRKSVASKATNGSAAKESKKLAIARIEERVARSEELDKEKVYSRILDALSEHPTQAKPAIEFYTAAEDAFQRFVILDLLGDCDDVLEELGYKYDDEGGVGYTPEAMFKICSELDTEEQLFILRKVMLDKYGSPNVNPYQANHHRYFLRKIAEGYKDIPIDQFEAEQKAIADKRRVNAEKRKAKLNPPKAKAKKKAKSTEPD